VETVAHGGRRAARDAGRRPAERPGAESDHRRAGPADAASARLSGGLAFAEWGHAGRQTDSCGRSLGRPRTRSSFCLRSIRGGSAGSVSRMRAKTR
jgi:hypothetical protein